LISKTSIFLSVDLWLVARIAIALMDLFFGVADSVASSGRSVIGFREGFEQTFRGLAAENKALWDELSNSDRYRAAMKKIEERSRASR